MRVEPRVRRHHLHFPEGRHHVLHHASAQAQRVRDDVHLVQQQPGLFHVPVAVALVAAIAPVVLELPHVLLLRHLLELAHLVQPDHRLQLLPVEARRRAVAVPHDAVQHLAQRPRHWVHDEEQALHHRHQRRAQHQLLLPCEHRRGQNLPKQQHEGDGQDDGAAPVHQPVHEDGQGFVGGGVDEQESDKQAVARVDHRPQRLRPLLLLLGAPAVDVNLQLQGLHRQHADRQASHHSGGAHEQYNYSGILKE
mmetsp:Transcript_39397/g.75473  ORF Transcript_39397/g.75473 Transcript_39397/m.75473 type:complete len:251 (+) Transcript_39397:1171-1923(+)